MMAGISQIDRKPQIKKYKPIAHDNIVEEIEEDAIELDEINELGSYNNDKFHYKKDDIEYLLSSQKDHNNIYVAKTKQSYTKYGKFMDKYNDK